MPAESAGGFALLKLYGFMKLYVFKAVLGMIGAALLYFVLPPVTAEGKFDQKEFVARLAAAGIGSCFFGDIAVQQFMLYLPSLRMDEHTGAVYLMVGAPFWWITRAVALWFQNRKAKDIGQLARDAKGPL